MLSDPSQMNLSKRKAGQAETASCIVLAGTVHHKQSVACRLASKTQLYLSPWLKETNTQQKGHNPTSVSNKTDTQGGACSLKTQPHTNTHTHMQLRETYKQCWPACHDVSCTNQQPPTAPPNADRCSACMLVRSDATQPNHKGCTHINSTHQATAETCAAIRRASSISKQHTTHP
jgi:hypothetical protein